MFHSNICDDKLLNDKYTCCICSDVYKQPSSPKSCSHIFCFECLINHKKTSVGCPICKNEFNIHEIKLNSQIANEINSLDYNCIQCYQKIHLRDLNKHREKCMIPVNHTFKPLADHNVPKNLPNRSTFICPFCNEKNFDVKSLRAHCNEKHKQENQLKVCPICASMPWGDSSQFSQNFLQHLNLRHKFEYDTYVDYNEEEDNMLQAAIKASLETN